MEFFYFDMYVIINVFFIVFYSNREDGMGTGIMFIYISCINRILNKGRKFLKSIIRSVF